MASNTIKGLTIEIGGDTTKLGKAVKDMEDKSRKAAKELKAIDSAIKLVPDSEELLVQKQEELAKAIGAASGKLDVLRDAEKQVQEQFRRGEVSEEQVKALQREIIVTTNAMEKYEKEAEDTAKALENMDKSSNQAEDGTKKAGDASGKAADELEDMEDKSRKAAKELDNVGEQAKDAGNGMGTAAAAVGTFVGNLALDVLKEAASALKSIGEDILQTGMGFESAMSNVRAVSGANAQEMEVLTEKAREMGKATVFSASEAADAMNYMAMAGWKTEDMLGGIEGVMNLAAASGEDLATTSDIVTDALTAFGKSADDAGRLADIMAAASSNANTNVAMMGDTFKYAASIAGSLGYSMEDTAIATGLMANAGIKGEQAGTSLRAVMTRLAAPTAESQKALDALGVSIDDGKGNMKSLMEVMEELRGSFGTLKISQDEFDQSMSRLDAAFTNGEMSESEYADAQEQLMQRAYGAEGAMKAEYASMIAGKNALSGFLAIVNAGEEDFDKLTEAVYGSAGAAKSMADTMIDNLSGDLQIARSAWQDFELTLYDSANTPLRDLVQIVSGEVLPALSALVTGADGADEQLGDSLGNLLTSLLGSITDALPHVASVGEQLLMTLITSILDMSPDLLNTGFDILDTLADGILTALPDIADALATAITENADIIAGRLPQLIETISLGLASAAPDIAQAALTMLTSIVQAIPVFVQNLSQAAPTIITALVTALVSNAPELQQGMYDLLLAILDAIPMLIEALLPVVPTIVTSLIDLLLEHGDELGAAALNMFMLMVQTLDQVGDKLIEILAVLLVNFLNQLGDFMPKIWELSSKIADKILQPIRGLAQKMRESGHNIMAGLFDGIADMAERVKQKALDIANSVLDAITKPFDIHSPSRKMHWVGQMIDTGLAEGIDSGSAMPLDKMEDMTANMLIEAEQMPAQAGTQTADGVYGIPQYTADPALLARLDRILRAIEDGHIIALDGDKVVGETIERIDTALDARRVAAEREG